LEVKSTRIGIQVPPLVVLPYNTMIYYPQLKSIHFHHCQETWHHLTSSGLSAGPIRESETDIRQAGGIPYLFRPWSTNLLVSRPDHTPKNRIVLPQRSIFNEWAQSAYLSIPIGGGIFNSVLHCVLFTHYSFLTT